MCHKLLCCFGHSEPENNRPHSADGVAATSSPQPPAAINGGAQAPSPQNNATINQDHEKQADDQIKNGSNQEKPISSPIQGGKQQIDKQEQQNRQEQDGKKQSKIAKAFSFRQKGNNEEKHPRVPPENHKSIEDMQKVPAQDVPPEEQGKNSPHEQDLGSNKLGNSNKEQQQLRPPPKEQVHPPKEYTDQKTKIFFAKGDKEFDAQDKHEDSV